MSGNLGVVKMGKWRILYLLFLAVVLLCVGCREEQVKDEGMQISLTSPAFRDGGVIPARYTCDGENISPPLRWGDLPAGTRALVLICDDPDAPGKTWVHWVLYDLPPDVQELPEGIPPKEALENGAKQGRNDFRKLGYGEPCPPGGTHRYFFKLYALDKPLGLAPGATKAKVLAAMEGHVLGRGQLIGKYSRR